MDPVKFRLMNMREEGDEVPAGGSEPKVGYKETLEAVADAAGWWDREAGENQGWALLLAIGQTVVVPVVSTFPFMRTGVRVSSTALWISLERIPRFRRLSLKFDGAYESVTIRRGDTDSAPYSTGSGGSVVTFTMGNTAKLAAEDAHTPDSRTRFRAAEYHVDDLELKDGAVHVISAEQPKSISLGELAAYSLSTTGGPIVGKGSFARQPSTPALAAQIAKVEVDPDTGRTRVLKLVASQDVGSLSTDGG